MEPYPLGLTIPEKNKTNLLPLSHHETSNNMTSGLAWEGPEQHKLITPS